MVAAFFLLTTDYWLLTTGAFMLLIITISTFICITFGVMGAYWLLFRPASAATERLKRLNDRGVMPGAAVGAVAESPAADIAERLAAPLNRLIPPSAAHARKLLKQPMQAGLYW